MRNYYFIKTYFIGFTIVYVRYLLILSKSIYFIFKLYILKDSQVGFFKEYIKYLKDTSY